jgi:ParB family transcriptional regulator, chromosome partitioning protein
MPDPRDPRDAKKKGLGRGLSALLPSAAPSRAPFVPSAPDKARPYFMAGIEDLYPSPEQPRRKFGESQLEELASSIRIHGVIAPLVVRPRPATEGGGYYLIAGERRWRASQRAGLHEVPVVVQEVDTQRAFERALVDNLQRADLGPLEEAAAYQRLVDEFSLTQDQVATRIGKDRSTVANSIRLLKLPASVRQLVEDERLTMGHARALLGFEHVDDMERAARAIVAKGLSVRATEALVKKARTPEKPARAPEAGKSPNVRDLEERLTRALGGPVKISEDEPGKPGRGSIEIRYLSFDHLERLLDRLL